MTSLSMNFLNLVQYLYLSFQQLFLTHSSQFFLHPTLQFKIATTPPPTLNIKLQLSLLSSSLQIELKCEVLL